MKQCISDSNPSDDREAPNWWLEMTQQEQADYLLQAKADYDRILSAEEQE